MRRRNVGLLLWGLALIAAGGLLLHLRIHPPAKGVFFWAPALWGGVCVVAVPLLLARPRTAPWGWTLNLLSVLVGTATMAWFSATHWKDPVTPLNVVLKSTLGDILILWAKVPVAHAVLLLHRAAEEPVPCPLVPGPYLEALPLPAASQVPAVRPLAAGARAALQVALVLAGLGVVGVAAVVGLQGTGAELAGLGPVAGGLKAAGQVLGLGAAALLMLQLPLAARLRLLDRAFGLDALMRAHRWLGATALVLAGLHPALLYGSGVYVLGAARWGLWPEGLGALAALALAVTVITGLWRAALGIPFEVWRRLHGVSFVAVALVAAHALKLGSDLEGGWARTAWLAILAGCGAPFVWVRVARPRTMGRHLYEVREVSPVSPDTWHLSLAPRAGQALPTHRPGQFAFLTLRRAGLPTETHPFTLSSCPAADGSLGFTIKQSGDFTATVGQTRPGDLASLDGPYGLFCYLERPAERYVFIAGGVGITPFLSMLRFMAATGETRPVTLIWGNRTEADIVYGAELGALGSRLPGLTVHHVLSEQPDYEGERGFVDEGRLWRLLTPEDLRGRAFVCGPPPMMVAVCRALRRLGMARGRVHTERFSL
jgi:predicted ferric reductase